MLLKSNFYQNFTAIFALVNDINKKNFVVIFPTKGLESLFLSDHI